MNINRHNYEEFFLLYVDKELSAADRKAVDVFVQENTDLQIELALLKQTVMPADDVVLQKKDWLYMEEDISALQDNLLLYADGELNATDKKAVESLLSKNIKAKAELALLQQTKLQPDASVVFEDKASLYRKEGGRVVGFKWWRVAAAAILIGLMLWTGVSVYKNNFEKKEGSEGIAKQNEINKGKSETPVIVSEQNATTVAEKNADVNSNTASTGQQNKTTAGDKTFNAVDKLKGDNTTSSQQNQNTATQNTIDKKGSNNLPKSYLEKINNNTSNESTVNNVSPEKNNSQRVSGSNETVVRTDPKENKIAIEDINVGKTNTTIAATQVVNTNTADDGGNSYLEVDNNKKRTALGGFLRKAKRVLERTTNVKTGEGIKIAGFEIALK